jgi:hypothetical protein
MHVPFWECLRDTYHWKQQDIKATFQSDALVPHLKACPYLNFTFCVKFAICNAYNMTLPAEIRATNTCACDLDMRLDFSENLQQWAFSCPHYHQPGALKKCVRRAFVQETRYKLLESSANLHGGVLATALMPQTVAGGVDEEVDRPSVHLPHVNNIVEPVDDEDIFKDLFRTETRNAAGSKAWLGDNATAEQVALYEREHAASETKRAELVEKLRAQYLQVEKLLDDALCQKIKDAEQQKREEAKLRLKANVVQCVGCTDVSAMYVFLPCYHMVMCERCAGKGISFRCDV